MSYHLPKVGLIHFTCEDGTFYNGQIWGRQEVLIDFLKGELQQRLYSNDFEEEAPLFRFFDIAEEVPQVLQALEEANWLEWFRQATISESPTWRVGLHPQSTYQLTGEGAAPAGGEEFEAFLNEALQPDYPLMLFTAVIPAEAPQQLLQADFEEVKEHVKKSAELYAKFSNMGDMTLSAFRRAFVVGFNEEVNYAGEAVDTVYEIIAGGLLKGNKLALDERVVAFFRGLYLETAESRNLSEDSGDMWQQELDWETMFLSDFAEDELMDIISEHFGENTQLGLKLTSIFFHHQLAQRGWSKEDVKLAIEELEKGVVSFLSRDIKKQVKADFQLREAEKPLTVDKYFAKKKKKMKHKK